MEYKITLSVDAIQITYMSAESEQMASEEAVAWLALMLDNAGLDSDKVKIKVMNVTPEYEHFDKVE
jgi:hypothetical protein